MRSSVATYKVILVGDAGVGKTSFVKRLTSGHFSDKYIPTLGCNVESYRAPQEGILNFWDCAGADEYQGLGTGYYAQARAAIIMFDVTSPNSMQNVKKWLEQTKNIPIRIVCANKCDLKPRSVSSADIQRFMRKCASHDVRGWYETSALGTYNLPTVINALFERLQDMSLTTNKPLLGRSTARSKL